MAQPSMVRRFEIELADSDRGVYETLDLRVAQHPSESDRYLVARVIARCLEHAEGLVFTKGLAADDEPALWQRDLTDRLEAWIEVGAPSTDRLHRASKLGARVVVYAWQRPRELAKQIAEAKVHRAEALEVRALDPAFLDRIAPTLDRNNRWELSVSGGGLYLTIAGKLHESTCERVTIAEAS
jgi:uncharacterized protein YaeQ